MRSTALLFAAIFIICSAGFAAVETVTMPEGVINSGWNLMCLPAIPVFVGGNAPGYPPDVLDELVGGGTGLDGRLTRWDACGQGTLAWDSQDAQTQAEFGNLLLGDGYWLYVDPGVTGSISYSGVTENDGIDMFISLPRAGWTLIGFPYSTPRALQDPPYYSGDPYLWENVKVTDGLTTKSMQDASLLGAGWISSVAIWWDSARQGSLDLGVPDDACSSDTMIAWHGYWVRTLKDNLGLILEAPNP